MGEAGCVAWMFTKKGLLMLDEKSIEEDKLIDLVLEAGAEDINRSEDQYEVTTPPESLEDIKTLLKDNNLETTFAEVTMIPQSTVKLGEKEAQSMLKLMEVLEDHDDVQNVYANFDIPKEVMEKIEV